jgi:hypothetical protein
MQMTTSVSERPDRVRNNAVLTFAAQRLFSARNVRSRKHDAAQFCYRTSDAMAAPALRAVPVLAHGQGPFRAFFVAASDRTKRKELEH